MEDKARAVDYGDVGRPLTKTEMQAKITAVEKDINDCNQTLDQVDALRNKVEAGETALAEMNAAVLAGAKAKFGRDANEVERIGGVRLSERARPVRQAKPAVKV